MPTDQEIHDNDGFVRDIIAAQAESQADKIICFGVQQVPNPLRGYILTDDHGSVQFVEKPEPDNSTVSTANRATVAEHRDISGQSPQFWTVICR